MTQLRERCKRLARPIVRLGRTVIRRLSRGLNRALPWPRECNLCGWKSYRFRPLLDHLPALRRDLLDAGVSLAEFEQQETLNLAEYACRACGAADRDRLIALAVGLPGQIPQGRSWKLLDVAPTATLQRLFRSLPGINYRSADLFREDVDDRVDVQDMSIYPDETFDGIVCSHVLEHVPDDRRAISELYRVLRPGGWCIALAPILLGRSTTDEDPTLTDLRERVRRFHQNDHLRMYSHDDFVARLSATGGNVTQIGQSHFTSATFERHGIHPRSLLYRLEKPPA